MIIKDVDVATKTKLNLGNFNINLPNTFLPKPQRKRLQGGLYRKISSFQDQLLGNNRSIRRRLQQNRLKLFQKSQIEMENSRVR
jgi:hypothetical protein